jgi:hypothetical protein
MTTFQTDRAMFARFIGQTVVDQDRQTGLAPLERLSSHGRIVRMTTLHVADRMLRPVTDCLTPEVARRIVDARLDAETQARIDELAAKANRGTLTDEEREEYAEFVEYIDLIGIIKAKARLLLKQRAG